MLWTLVIRDLRVRYSRSVLGYVWTVLDPLLMSLIYFLVFVYIFKRGDVGHQPYFLFLVVGLLSVAVVAISVHPGAATLRAALSLPFLRWLGSRSYGLYLWHWPVFMVTRQQDYPWMSSTVRFWLRVAVTFALTARAFGSRRPGRDLALGLALGAACWVLFSRLLGLALPGFPPLGL